jgi:hypothetical protein
MLGILGQLKFKYIKISSHAALNIISEHHYHFLIRKGAIRLPVHSLAQDITHLVGGARKSGVVHSEDSVAQAGSQQDPVASAVDVGDDAVSLGQARADGRLRGGFHRLVLGVSQGIDGTPVDVASVGVATMLLEPGVQSGWVVVAATSSNDHGHRAHSTACGANGLRAGAKLLARPAGIALLVLSPAVTLATKSHGGGVVDVRVRLEGGDVTGGVHGHTEGGGHHCDEQGDTDEHDGLHLYQLVKMNRILFFVV